MLPGSASVSASQTKTKEESAGTSQTAVDQTRTQEQTGLATGRTTQAQQQQQRQQLLSDPTVNMLESLVSQLAPQGSLTAGQQPVMGAAEQNVLALTNRAGTAEQDINALIEPIMSDARLQGERELQTLQTQLAQQAGGSVGNTFVTAATAQGRADLESKMASQEAQLQINARTQQSQEMLQSAAALSQNLQSQQQGAGLDLQSFLGTLGALKGATSVTEGTLEAQGTSQEETLQNLTAMLESLTQSEFESKSRSQSTTVSATVGSG